MFRSIRPKPGELGPNDRFSGSGTPTRWVFQSKYGIFSKTVHIFRDFMKSGRDKRSFAEKSGAQKNVS